jgi:uncharacterized protein with PQ loop repeat
MPSESIVVAANIGQAVVPLISLMAYIPQWAKIWRTRSSASISARAWAAWTVSGTLAVFYAITQLLLNGHGWALVLSTSMGLTFVLVTLAMVLRFRQGSSAKPSGS